MSKGRQLWPGDTMRAFFRAHIRRETTLDDATTERLAEALNKAVNRALVWDMPEARQDKPTAGRTSAPSNLAGLAQPAERHADANAFNPYLFSAIVVLAKFGRDGLLKRLQEIKSAENLRIFAEAQHVAVAPKLKRPEDIRKAIVVAAEQRLADRKAAAS
jgi:hypothetical protein